MAAGHFDPAPWFSDTLKSEFPVGSKCMHYPILTLIEENFEIVTS